MARTTREDIQRNLVKKLNDWMDEVWIYGGIPKDFVLSFKEAIQHAKPKSHQIHSGRLRLIVAKTEGELTNGEIGLMTNVIGDCDLDWIKPVWDDAIDFLDELEALAIKYNVEKQAKQRILDKEADAQIEVIEPGHRQRILQGQGGSRIIQPNQ